MPIRTIYPILNEKFTIILRLIAESAGHFWQPAEFENVANPYFENLKHLQNPGHLSLTALSMFAVRTPKTVRFCHTIFRNTSPITLKLIKDLSIVAN